MSLTDKAYEELIELTKDHAVRFKNFTEDLRREAIELHRTRCENPPGKACEKNFIHNYARLFDRILHQGDVTTADIIVIDVSDLVNDL